MVHHAARMTAAVRDSIKEQVKPLTPKPPTPKPPTPKPDQDIKMDRYEEMAAEMTSGFLYGMHLGAFD